MNQDEIRHDPTSFFQSLKFARFQEKIPYRGKYWELPIEGEAPAILIRNSMRFGKSWLWIPYGPNSFSENFFEDLHAIAKSENAAYVRIEPGPRYPLNTEERLGKKYTVRTVHSRLSPQCTRILYLNHSIEELLAAMKSKGRYSIRTAQRHGIRTERYTKNAKNLDFAISSFHALLQKTAKRQGLHIHPRSYYELFFEHIEEATLYLGFHDELSVAGILTVDYEGTRIYYYGASAYEYRQLMAPYLLHFQAIQDAKDLGLTMYDFFGVAPPQTKNHQLAGVTEFKEKFGGELRCYPPAFDVIYQPKVYSLLRFARSIRSAVSF